MPASRSIVAVLLFLLFTLSGCSKSTQTPRDMVATANPLASAAAVEMLKDGGNAIDAAVAAQLVLGLVEPQSSGLSGGAFLMFFDARRKQVRAIDGREKAPLAAGETLFIGADGQPLKRGWVEIGGRSVGVPGTPRSASPPWQAAMARSLHSGDPAGGAGLHRLAAACGSDRRCAASRRGPDGAAALFP